MLGSLLALAGIAFLAGGGGVLWAVHTQRDAAGFFTTSTQRFATDTSALTHEGVKIADIPWIRPGKIATVRIEATPAASGKALFVGIARSANADAYLAGVHHAKVEHVRYHPFRVDYVQVPGEARAAPPATRHIWVASAAGTGAATVKWPVENGRWSLVVMNADASPGVAANLSFGVDVSYLGWIATGLIAAGFVLLGLAALLLVVGVRGLGGGASGERATAPAESTAAQPQSQPYPALIGGRLDEPLSRWLWLVKWLLAIPHAIVLAFLWVAFWVLTVIAWFAILLTGRYPRGIFDFNVGVLRWTWRVAFYATSAIGTDRYPPFSLQEEPNYPATLSVEYPERLSRGLVLVKWWLLALPHYLVVAFFIGGGTWGWAGNHWAYRAGGGGLIALLVFFAGVMLLFTGRYPRSLYDLVVGFDRWVFRVAVYVLLLRDEYPPFRLDVGGDEPPPPAVSPPVVPAGV